MTGPSAQSEHYRVLLLEDNPGDTDLVIERLVNAGNHSFDIITGSTLGQALAILSSEDVDALILDLNLPDSQGIDTLRAVKDFRADLPILVLTGIASEELRHAAFEEGVQDFIGKDDPPSQMLARSLLYALERFRATERQREVLKLVSSSPDGILVVNFQGVVQFVNLSAMQLFGRSREEFVGEQIGFSITDGETTELNISTGSEKRIAEMRVVQMQWLDEPAYIAYLRDVTEKRRLGEQLQLVQKMDAIGRLAGGVAHDFNNLLSVINGYADILLESSYYPDEGKELLTDIRKAGQRAAELTRQLLAFGRKSIVQPKPLNLNSVLSDLERMLRRLIGEDVLLATVYDPQLGLVLADPGQLEQVIMNLAINARDAMPRGGHLTIETRNLLLEDNMSETIPDLAPGHYVELVVSDNGMGMDDETIAHIFEPFFTTKDVGEGTGLGLATSYGIIRQSGGRITVYSEPGHGTTFRIYLPLTEQPAVDENSSARLARVPSGHETILLVEDEPGVRRYCRMVLQSKGYKVIEANGFQQALELARGHVGQIDLLLTDVVMPRMSGRELNAQVQVIRPEIKVMYMSGYTDDAVVRHGILRTDVPLLQKPFTAAALASAVRRALDESPDPSGPETLQQPVSS